MPETELIDPATLPEFIVADYLDDHDSVIEYLVAALDDDKADPDHAVLREVITQAVNALKTLEARK